VGVFIEEEKVEGKDEQISALLPPIKILGLKSNIRLPQQNQKASFVVRSNDLMWSFESLKLVQTNLTLIRMK
jgi:hypothetical protein